MRMHACAAAVVSVATLALAPLAAAHGTWWRADADHGQSFNQMQSASSEAPAFHTGDRSIYDSSRGLETRTRIAATPQPNSSAMYERRSMSAPSVMSGDSRPGATADSRPGATLDRYGAPLK